MPSELDKPRESLWERLARPAPASRQTLSPPRIAAAAVEIADAEGLDAITMRRLATGLGVAPMAPYRHLAGKDDLLELMVDHVYAALRLPDDLGWRDSMCSLARQTRELILRHRWLAQLPSQVRLSLTPNRMALAEQALSVLSGSGLDADAMMSVFRSVDAYVHGALAYECAIRDLMHEQGWSDGDRLRSELAPQMTWHMRTGRYPAFQRYLHTAARKDDAEWQFDRGLGYVLDGIAATLESR
jgi:AcrR family transcriptional regulator